MISATITGNLGRDAEIKTTQSGDTICEFSVASSRRAKGGKDETTWVKCSLWGKRGQALSQYLTKGARVAVVGELSVREYAKKDGTKGVSIEVRASDIDLMGGGTRAEKPVGNGYQPDHDTAPSGDEIPF